MGKQQVSKRDRHRLKAKVRERKKRQESVKGPKSVARRMCIRKVRHATREGAESAAAYCSNTSGVTIGVYHCPLCDGWHLTHKVGGSSDA